MTKQPWALGIIGGLLSLLLVFNTKAHTIATINTEGIIRESSWGKEIEKKMQAQGKQVQAELKKRQDELEKQVHAFQQMATSMSEEQQRKTQSELQRKYEQLQQQAVDREQKLREEQAKYINELYAQIKKAAATVAQAKGYDFILDEKVVIFNAHPTDVTPMVMAELPTAAPSSGPVKPAAANTKKK